MCIFSVSSAERLRSGFRISKAAIEAHVRVKHPSIKGKQFKSIVGIVKRASSRTAPLPILSNPNVVTRRNAEHHARLLCVANHSVTTIDAKVLQRGKVVNNNKMVCTKFGEIYGRDWSETCKGFISAQTRGSRLVHLRKTLKRKNIPKTIKECVRNRISFWTKIFRDQPLKAPPPAVQDSASPSRGDAYCSSAVSRRRCEESPRVGLARSRGLQV